MVIAVVPAGSTTMGLSDVDNEIDKSKYFSITFTQPGQSQVYTILTTTFDNVTYTQNITFTPALVAEIKLQMMYYLLWYSLKLLLLVLKF